MNSAVVERQGIPLEGSRLSRRRNNEHNEQHMSIQGQPIDSHCLFGQGHHMR